MRDGIRGGGEREEKGERGVGGRERESDRK